MEEKKLTDEDVIKALKNCINGDHKTKCKNCYYHIYDDTCLSMDKAVLNLINSLQSKLEKLKNDSRNKTNSIRELRDKKNKLQKQVDELKSQNEWLTNEKAYLKKCADAFLGDYKNAVKDTAKVILSMFDDRNYISEKDLKKAIAERYGVEVE